MVFYLILKSLHVAAVITWLAGMLTLSVFFMSMKFGRSPVIPDERFISTFTHWNRWVTTPAMMLTWVLGITLAAQGNWFTAPWLITKLILVFILSALHGVQSGSLRRFSESSVRNIPGALKFSSASIIIITTVIAFLVVGKPF